MRTIARVGVWLAAGAILLAPALWNGFPLLQWDTGGYLARWYEGYLVPSRSVVYGLLLTAGAPFDFWPVVVLQIAATIWVLRLLLRTHGFDPGSLVFLGLVTVLSVATTLPWITDILLTDIFAGLSVLALHLVVVSPHKLSSGERVGLVVLVAFSAATHSATLAVLLALTLAAVLAALMRRDLMPPVAIARAVAALALGAALVLAANYLLVRRLAWTPGGYGIAFGRLLQDDIVKRYLDDHCPDPTLRLCPYRNELPKSADEFLWSGGIFNELGRFAGLGTEMERIVLESLVAYPRAQIETALAATGQQLVEVASGEGVLTSIWHTYGMIERFTPGVLPAMKAARQQRGELDFTAVNRLHVPVALLSLLLLPLIALLGWRRPAYADLGRLAATLMIATLANAAVCGVLSGPHPRYGARIVWIASLVVLLVPWRALMTLPSLRQVHGAAAAAAVPPP